MPELIHDVIDKNRLKAENNEVSLNLSVSPNTPFAFGDIGMTERVMDNLLDNAIRHTPTKGTIDVTISTVDDGLNVSISDSGPGISPDHMPYIFDPFYRGDKTDKSTQNAGLGLAIAKHIMDLQKGSITAGNSPTGSGSGSIFSFQLPRHLS